MHRFAEWSFRNGDNGSTTPFSSKLRQFRWRSFPRIARARFRFYVTILHANPIERAAPAARRNAAGELFGDENESGATFSKALVSVSILIKGAVRDVKLYELRSSVCGKCNIPVKQQKFFAWRSPARDGEKPGGVRRFVFRLSTAVLHCYAPRNRLCQRRHNDSRSIFRDGVCTERT